MSRPTLKPWVPSNPKWIAGFVAVSMAGTAALMGGATLFAWSGLYDIAASDGHWQIARSSSNSACVTP
jgi:hypothetical protein